MAKHCIYPHILNHREIYCDIVYLSIFWLYLTSDLGTEEVDGLWGKAPSPEGGQGKQAGVVPVPGKTVQVISYTTSELLCTIYQSRK